jgi:TRAP-type C4-dicarboxylate transport system permease small subunit
MGVYFMLRLSDVLEKGYNGILIILNLISVVVIFLMAVWVFCDVTGRYVFNHPIPGTTELVKCYIVAIVFLGIAYTMNQKRHIRTTLIIDRLSPVWRAWCEILTALIGVAVFASLCVFSWEAAWDSWLVREFDGVQLKVPVYPARLAVVIGSCLLVIQCLLDLFNCLGFLMNRYKRKKS